MPVKIESVEHIKKFGEFKLDGLWMKSMKVDHPPVTTAKISVIVELVPYARLEDGTCLFDQEVVKKIYIPDAQEYIFGGGSVDFANAYGSIELAIIAMMAEQHGWTCAHEVLGG